MTATALMMQITTGNSCGEKAINSEEIAEFWRNGDKQERVEIFRQVATFHKVAFEYNLHGTLEKTFPVMLGFLTWLNETVELFDVESIEKILATVNYLIKNKMGEGDVVGNELQSKLLELLQQHISNIDLEDVSPRALAALVLAYLKQIAIENREIKMKLELNAARKIINSYQTFPGALFVNLLHRPTENNVGSLKESRVRVALQEVMLNAYNRLKWEHSLLGLEAPTVDDMNSTQLQIRDAVHHFIIRNDQHSTVGVYARDIYEHVTPLLQRLGSSDQMTMAFRGALADLLHTGKIATFGTDQPPRFFISVRTNIL